MVSKSQLVTITGGKWTTYRKMAEDTIDKIIALGKLPKKVCKTEHLQIHGAIETVNRHEHLSIYGSDQKAMLDLMERNPELGEKLHPGLEFRKVEVFWAVKNEMARTVEDVLARRVRALFLDATIAIEIAPIVANMLAKELDKDAVWKQRQLQEFRTLASQYVLTGPHTPTWNLEPSIN